MPSRTIVFRQPERRGIARRLDLSGIYRNCIFRSLVRASSHSRLAQVLDNDHELQWGPGNVDSALFGVEASRLKLIVLRYGPQVTIHPRAFAGFSLVQMPLQGSMQIRCGKRVLPVEVGQAAIINQGEAVRLNWSEGCEQVILRVPHIMLNEVAQHPSLGVGSNRVSCRSVHVLDETSTSEWVVLVQALLNSLLSGSEGGAQSHPAWVDQMERSLALFTLLQLQRGVDSLLTEDKPDLKANPDQSATEREALHESEYRMEVLRHYVTKNLGAPLALVDLARAAGVSPRTVYIDSMRQYGVGPMAWLRGVRLETARQKILSNPSCNVTDIALECGFGHLGRFASYYRDRFKELPSETAYGKR